MYCRRPVSRRAAAVGGRGERRPVPAGDSGAEGETTVRFARGSVSRAVSVTSRRRRRKWPPAAAWKGHHVAGAPDGPPADDVSVQVFNSPLPVDRRRPRSLNSKTFLSSPFSRRFPPQTVSSKFFLFQNRFSRHDFQINTAVRTANRSFSRPHKFRE